MNTSNLRTKRCNRKVYRTDKKRKHRQNNNRITTGLSNKETKITKIITGFIQSLSSCLPKNISITTINENQSTKEALYKINILNKKEKEKDTISAGIILERYIKENVRE